MSLTIEHECPQCGGQLQLEESDQVLTCPFCGVAQILISNPYPCFTLPVKARGNSGELFWVPYLHFKGSAFWLVDGNVSHRILHLSALGVPDPHLAPSLGLRSQTQRLRFMTAKTPGTFLPFARKPSDLLRGALLTRGAKMSSAPAYIGESASLIYLPLIKDKRSVVDGVSLERLQQLPDLPRPHVAPPPSRELWFLPAICPRCGASFSAQPQTVAHPCLNCNAVWESAHGQLCLREVETVQANHGDGQTLYLPFWRFGIAATGGAAMTPVTMGGLAELTGQPWAQRQPQDRPWQFWSPAFKIRPRMLLRLCERLSLSDPLTGSQSGLPRQHRHAVTLPAREAAEMLPVTLASMAFHIAARQALFALRPKLSAVCLVYLPFALAGQELVNHSLQLSVNRSALGFGAHL